MGSVIFCLLTVVQQDASFSTGTETRDQRVRTDDAEDSREAVAALCDDSQSLPADPE